MKRNSKNILHLMGMDSTKYGGIERFNVELSRQLAAKGYHSVFVYESLPVAPQFLDDMKATGAELVVIKSRGHTMDFCKRFWQLMRQYDFCLMHAHFTKARFYAVPLALLYGLKNIVYTFHSAVPSLKDIKFHTRVWFHTFNKYCRIVAVSKDIENVARRNWSKATIQNIYLGISPCVADRVQARKELQIPADTIMVMCTANFNYIKGLDVLIKAIAQLQHRIDLSNVIFYIVGQPDDDKAELQQLINELHIETKINLEGISNQIPKYLNAADIYIQPSRSEGLPISLMEACSVGLPIIASRVGGIPEVAIERGNAILFEVENINECATALQTMLMDSSLRQKLGENSKRVYAEKFQISNNVNKLIEYYNLN